MSATDINNLAAENFEAQIQQKSYPGRGLVVGRSTVEDGWLMIYWLMGRSTSSRNRRLVVEGGMLRTEPIDTRQIANPELLIYEAMLELPGIYLVSNGDQTRTIYEALQTGGTFDEALGTREREPDVPHYTPRISAMLDLRQHPGAVTLSILKANQMNPEHTDRFTYRPAIPVNGFGFGLTTYRGNGVPLPSFSGEPLLLPCKGSAEEVLNYYWNGLNADNRVALAVKQVSTRDGSSRIVVRNRFVD